MDPNEKAKAKAALGLVADKLGQFTSGIEKVIAAMAAGEIIQDTELERIENLLVDCKKELKPFHEKPTEDDGKSGSGSGSQSKQ